MQPPGEILNQGSVPRMAWESPLYLREIFPPSPSLPQSRLGVLGKGSSSALSPPFIPALESTVSHLPSQVERMHLEDSVHA